MIDTIIDTYNLAATNNKDIRLFKNAVRPVTLATYPREIASNEANFENIWLNGMEI